jgi:hypothetical protein
MLTKETEPKRDAYRNQPLGGPHDAVADLVCPPVRPSPARRRDGASGRPTAARGLVARPAAP